MTVPVAAVPRVRPVGARRAWLVAALVVAVLLLVGSVAGTAVWLARHGGGLGAFPGGPGISSGEEWPDRRPGPDWPPGDIHERMRDWMRGDRPWGSGGQPGSFSPTSLSRSAGAIHIEG